jgi:hypothetical protein
MLQGTAGNRPAAMRGGRLCPPFRKKVIGVGGNLDIFIYIFRMLIRSTAPKGYSTQYTSTRYFLTLYL